MKRIYILIIALITIINIKGQDKPYYKFEQTGGAGDILYWCLGRGDGGRAFVHGGDNSLVINYNHDFTGGVNIGGYEGTNALALFNHNSLYPISLNVKSKIMSAYIVNNIGIGIENPKDRLEVNGTIRSKEVKIEATGWSDFVFNKEYKLPTLQEVEQHINDKGHLPDIPSESEVIENGISVGEMQAKLLQKIEELTLYVIDLKKENEVIKQELKELKKEK